jgi:predicted LPLAT superfamily acyltransferase
LPTSLVDNNGLVRRYQVLDVDERVFASVDLKLFQSLDDQLSQIFSLPLGIVDSIAEVLIAVDENVEDREYLTIVGDKCLTNKTSTTCRCK